MHKGKIILYDYINSTSATSPDVGNDVYDKIYPLISSYLEENIEFIIDFTNIDRITTAFLNNALGKFFLKCDKDKLLSLISFTGLSNTMQLKTLQLSLSNAEALSQVKNNSEI